MMNMLVAAMNNWYRQRCRIFRLRHRQTWTADACYVTLLHLWLFVWWTWLLRFHWSVLILLEEIDLRRTPPFRWTIGERLQLVLPCVHEVHRTAIPNGCFVRIIWRVRRRGFVSVQCSSDFSFITGISGWLLPWDTSDTYFTSSHCTGNRHINTPILDCVSHGANR